MKRQTFFITTPIYYPSDNLHIGHAFCSVMADTMARYKRMRGYDVMFLTGTDEHGQKIERIAKKLDRTPKEYVDGIVAGIFDLWKLMNISYDRFIRTTDDIHIKAVQKIFKKLYDQGDIYKSEYEGSYCTPCESFWTDRQLIDGKCPDCGRPVEKSREESYFFRLSKYQKALEDHIANNPGFITPESRLHEMVNNFLKPGLEDLCVSRTSFDWGIPVTFDEGHVIYVWIDALSNYITALGYLSDDESAFERYWPADVQLVGKEIIRFHTIIWPIMLIALGLPLPKRVIGHGWLLLDGGKMSKSVGNVVDPGILCEKYGVDAIRYFLLRDIAFGADGNFTNEALLSRINSDLANDLGNLLSRTGAMVEKYFGGTVLSGGERAELDESLFALTKSTVLKYEQSMEALHFGAALSSLWELLSRANKYIDETMPWALAKDESKTLRLQAVLYNLCEILRVAGVLLTPAMPETAARIAKELGLSAELTRWETILDPFTLPGFQISRGDAIFPRLDIEKELSLLGVSSVEAKPQAVPEKKKEKRAPEKTEVPDGVIIDIEDFAKVELRVAQITSCERVSGADKLYQIGLDLGYETRQIVSGIAPYYEPADLISKKIIVVANLKPAKLRGVLSQGMLLAASSGEHVYVIFADDRAALGSKVR